MERYTIQQRIEIIKIHYKHGDNLAETVRKTKAYFGRFEAPSRTAIGKLIKKFEKLGYVSDVKHETRMRRSRTAENIAAVARSLKDNPSLSIPRRSMELGISQTTLHRIMHKDLGIKVLKEEIEDASELVEINFDHQTNEITSLKKNKKRSASIKNEEGGDDDDDPVSIPAS